MSGDAKQHEGEAAPAGKSKKKLIIIVAVVLLLVLGGGGFMMMKGGDAKEEKTEEAHEEEKHYAQAKLDPFIVNLAQSGSFLKIGILIEYDPSLIGGEPGGEGGGGGHGGGGGGGGAAPAGLPGMLGQREPMIRDAIIRVLSAKKGEEVLTVQGKDQLKEELVEAINEAVGLEEHPVVSVYFTEFIVQ